MFFFHILPQAKFIRNGERVRGGPGEECPQDNEHNGIDKKAGKGWEKPITPVMARNITFSLKCRCCPLLLLTEPPTSSSRLRQTRGRSLFA
jgi:hypothetical protein